jgi:hypothetical protein
VDALVRGIQEELNRHGFLDFEDKPLKVDGQWGRRTQSAFGAMAQAAALAVQWATQSEETTDA